MIIYEVAQGNPFDSFTIIYEVAQGKWNPLGTMDFWKEKWISGDLVADMNSAISMPTTPPKESFGHQSIIPRIRPQEADFGGQALIHQSIIPFILLPLPQ